MIGNTSESWRIGDVVRKVYRVDNDKDITNANMEAVKNEANVYLILGEHRLVAKWLSIGPEKSYVDLEFYSQGTLRDYISSNRSNISDQQLKTWAYQLVESVAYIRSKGVRHADLRLDQWLLDENLLPHLTDFNGSGFDSRPELGLDSTPATSIECASHCLPRDLEKDSTVESDLFALGSPLYELMTNSRPYDGEEDGVIESNFAKQIFPPVEHLLMGDVIMACWRGQYTSAEQILDHLRPKP
ncbi:hypothetical protein jhhlp_000707 [Lomentospora prolificans]|uniref:Protein kinase domain-containing protein n=1 Tax=Lomentospora prolificans TaxID=41688 RepID=A0A2N3NJ84_9PEZI|nr:hypothetical protein jhhlp_000707 [Lomentospora prolificans]